MDTKCDKENFVTVVSVGAENPSDSMEKNQMVDTTNSGYVTVLTIKDDEDDDDNDDCVAVKNVIEEVLVYRLPGERLGFGLKFEGGTKSNELVKRLFIQSCAPDSPASRVKSSWGHLNEGDEVLEIDGASVNKMTRIDCVRCLKDSNVVIKLLIRHFYEKEPDTNNKSTEDLPQVISAEKKRNPPPPPPVPPRKIPRKFHRVNGTAKENQETNQNKTKKHQSPRNSGRLQYSPEVIAKNRKLSDGSLGPPDAEVYTDLFSQDSRLSLSESDDTGSSISTVVDRFSSFPTTTTSSLSGSLPSTPTSIQKHLDLANLLNTYEDEEIASTFNKAVVKCQTNDKQKGGEESTTLQPPSSFQDAALSYGNENVKLNEDDENLVTDRKDKCIKKPPVPPRSRDLNKDTHDNILMKNLHDENMNVPNLPRLVDFVPKLSTSREALKNPSEIVKLFLDNERRESEKCYYDIFENDTIDDDLYDSKLSNSSLLSTIGEVEEEDLTSYSSSISAPIVVIENTDNTSKKSDSSLITNNKTCKNDVNNTDSLNTMETLPSDSRQPPDGHEFPDYEETNTETSVPILIYKNFETSINQTKKELPSKIYKSTECINLTQSSFNINSDKSHNISNNNKDKYNSKDDSTFGRTEVEVTLHTRSQSLIDMSGLSKQKNDRWNLLAEQRRKGLSKLKGLVIPEHISENDTSTAINLPEILSQAKPVPLVLDKKIDKNPGFLQQKEQVNLPLTSPPPWTLNNNTIPKYSPAFKRKSLQVYPTITHKIRNGDLSKKDSVSAEKVAKYVNTAEIRIENSPILPKSDLVLEDKQDFITSVDLRKCEGESDDDSAVSSSQSSYFSKYSPPLSPNSSSDILDYESNFDNNQNANYGNNNQANNLHGRLLKPASVEAINRKNILASAKCRSGKDLKVGSPVIERKCSIENEIVQDEKQNKSITNEKEIEEGKVKVDEIDRMPEKRTWEKEKVPIIQKALNTSFGSGKNSIIDLKFNKNLNKKESRVNSILQNTKSLSVTNLRKSFENLESMNPPLPINNHYQKIKKLSTNKIEEKQKMFDGMPVKKIQTIEKKVDTKKIEEIAKDPISNDCDLNGNNVKTIVLYPRVVGESIGITLAGGTDYESKEITIHRIRYGSVAYEDGQLKKGDKILSINGKSTKDKTHAESVGMLKEAVPKFDLIVEDNPTIIQTEKKTTTIQPQKEKVRAIEKAVTHKISLLKDGAAGLGFSIEGGKDSLQGDVPLRIKKIFTGGAADKNGELNVGDELISINKKNFGDLNKIEAWNFMKKLPDGHVTIHIHRQAI